MHTDMRIALHIGGPIHTKVGLAPGDDLDQGLAKLVLEAVQVLSHSMLC